MKITRLDGMPLLPEHASKYKEEFRQQFDELEKELGRFGKNNAEEFERRLTDLEDSIKEKYPCADEIAFPDTPEKIKELTEKYNSVICFQMDEHYNELYILLSPVTGPGA